MTLLVYGWVALDEIETPFNRVAGSLGGSATFAALAASLFTDVRLLAAVGPDFPEGERAKLQGRRIDLGGVVTVPGETSRWGARYHFDMNTRDTLYTVLGVNEHWQPALPPSWRHSHTAFMAAAHPRLQRDLLAQLATPRATMVDTIKLFIDGHREDVFETMRHARFVTVNDSEARDLARVPSIARATRHLLAKGAEAVIIKLGEYGAAYRSDHDYFVAPGYPLEDVIDPTGAGDAFAGGFLGYLDSVPDVSTAEIRRAIIYGSTVASYCVEGFGPARLLDLERDDVERRYREFRALTHFEVGE